MYRRTRKLINTRFQLRMTMWFVGVTMMVMVMQFFVLAETLSTVGMALPHDSEIFFGGITGTLIKSFLFSLGIALSVVMVTGILLTHRIAGPAYRFKQFGEAVLRGEHPRECKIRQGDELQDLCELLNRLTADMRSKCVDPAEKQTESTEQPNSTEETGKAA